MIALDMGPEVEGLRKTIQRLKDKKSQYEERVEELKLEITLRCENISKLNNMIEQYQCDLNNRLRQITIPLQRGAMTMTNQEQYEEMCEKAKKYDELTAQRASTGYWEYVHYDPDYLVYSGTCTACKRKHESTDHVGKLPFCPHCGAQMLGERNPVLITADEDGESE